MFIDLSQAMADILALNSKEMEAAMAGRFIEIKAIRAELQKARERKDVLLLDYKTHVETHGC